MDKEDDIDGLLLTLINTKHYVLETLKEDGVAFDIKEAMSMLKNYKKLVIQLKAPYRINPFCEL